MPFFEERPYSLTFEPQIASLLEGVAAHFTLDFSSRNEPVGGKANEDAQRGFFHALPCSAFAQSLNKLGDRPRLFGKRGMERLVSVIDIKRGSHSRSLLVAILLRPLTITRLAGFARLIRKIDVVNVDGLERIEFEFNAEVVGEPGEAPAIIVRPMTERKLAALLDQGLPRYRIQPRSPFDNHGLGEPAANHGLEHGAAMVIVRKLVAVEEAGQLH